MNIDLNFTVQIPPAIERLIVSEATADRIAAIFKSEEDRELERQLEWQAANDPLGLMSVFPVQDLHISTLLYGASQLTQKLADWLDNASLYFSED